MSHDNVIEVRQSGDIKCSLIKISSHMFLITVQCKKRFSKDFRFAFVIVKFLMQVAEIAPIFWIHMSKGMQQSTQGVKIQIQIQVLK